MARLAMLIDLKACVGCAACSVACKMENEVPVGGSRLWIREREMGTFPNLTVEYRPEQCAHCENPPCVPVCPTGATYQNQDGLVLVDYHKCIACAACVAACPYDARFISKAGYVEKCTFCAHRLARNEEPACVTTCPTYARVFGDLDDPGSEINKAIQAAGQGHTLRPELGLKPKVIYVNPPSKQGLTRKEAAQS
jgi:Fe-S-cluster-containing dehydrogenase component